MTHKVWFQAAVAITFTLVIIRLFMEVKEVFSPLFVLINTIFLPLLISGVLFYLTRPILQFIMRRKFPKWSAVLLIFALIIFLFWLLYVLLAPIITEEINSLEDNGPSILQQAEDYGQYLLNQRQDLPDIVKEQINNLTGQLTGWASSISSWLFSFLQALLSGLLALVLVPFFLAYILIDYEKFAPFVSHFFAGEKRTWVRKTLHDLDETLKSYIVGQLLVSLTVGTMLLIGYLIIGLDYAFILAFIGVITNVIPFLGPFLAVIPAIVVAFVQDPIMVVYVAIIMLIAQQIEGNLITPNIMGKALDVHPLTVITLVLAAWNIAGFWGIILAIPFYAVVKTVVTNFYAKRKEIEETATKDIH